MAEVFISYSRSDRARVAPIQARMMELGIDAWFDVEQLASGEDFGEVILARLQEAKAILVCWSKKAASSHWVRGEAHYAQKFGTYVPVFLEDCDLIPQYIGIHTEDLSNWTGDASDPVWLKVVDRLAKLIGREGVSASARVLASGDDEARYKFAQAYPGEAAAEEIWRQAEARHREAFIKRMAEARIAVSARFDTERADMSTRLAAAEPAFDAWLAEERRGAAKGPRPDPVALVERPEDGDENNLRNQVASLSAALAKAKAREEDLAAAKAETRLLDDETQRLSYEVAALSGASAEARAREEELGAAKTEIAQLSGQLSATRAAFGPQATGGFSRSRAWALGALIGVLAAGAGALAERGLLVSKMQERESQLVKELSTTRSGVASLNNELVDARTRAAGLERDLGAIRSQAASAVAEVESLKVQEKEADEKFTESRHKESETQSALADARRNEAATLTALSNTVRTKSPIVAAKLALAASPRSGNDPAPKLEATTKALSDAVAGLRVSPMVLRHDAAVNRAAFSPDGARVVTASADGTARIWDAATGRAIAVMSDGGVRSAAFSSDGARVVAACEDNTARIWPAATGRPITVLRGHDSRVFSAAFSPDGARVVTASADTTARIWVAATGGPITVLLGHVAIVLGAAFSPDGARVVTASADGTARIWDAATGRAIAVLRGHDGARVVTASADGTARIWDAATGRAIAVLRGHDNRVFSAAFSPDGARVVTASEDNTARIWDAATGKGIAELRHEGPVKSAAFSPDGARVVTASEDNTARIWDAATGKGIAELRHEGPVKSAAFSPDGARVVTASNDETARIWYVGTDACVLLPDHDLTDVEREYGLTKLAPICQADPPPPDGLPH